MAIFDNIDPKYENLALNPNAKRLSDEAYDRANNSSPQNEYETTLSGVEKSSDSFIPTGKIIGQTQNHLGMISDDALNSAIAERAKRHYESSLNDLKRQTALGSTKDYENRLNLAESQISAKRKYDYAIYERQMKQFQTEEAARNNAVGSLLGIVGTVAAL